MKDRDWLVQFEAKARQEGDTRRMRLVELVFEADLHRETNPDRMLSLIDEGRQLARALREPWWALFFDDRRAGALMKYKGDAQAGLELAVRNALEARKPIYEQFPWRFRIHDHLVVGYLHTDPAGYADEIIHVLDWLADQVPLTGSPRFLVLARRRWLASELGDREKAEQLAMQGLLLAESEPDALTGRSHAVFCYSHLCEISRQRGEWDLLRQRALIGEALARQVGHQLELAEFQMWQAFLARREGNHKKAIHLHQQACRRVAQLGMPPDHIYFDALCAYYEQENEYESALASRDRELSLLVGRGRWAAEIRCRVHRVELLRKLDQPVHLEVDTLRQVAQKLRRPEAVLDHVNKLVP